MFHHLAEKKDFDAVYDLYMDEYANAYLTYDPMSKEEFLPIFKELLASKTLYVVQDGEETIATYRLVPYTARQAHTVLGAFTIRSGSQGKGIGAQILSDIKKACEKENKIRIELTVDKDNMRAINLYKRMGFEIEGTVRKSYRLGRTGQFYDEYLMAVLSK